MRTLPFYGKGLAWVPRINPATGGFVISSGVDEHNSVELQYIASKWSIRDDVSLPTNHIAESVAHILLTKLGEHDTLPWFGSRLMEAVFEPNTEEFQLLFQFYLKTATDRWEKRVNIPDVGGVIWGKKPYLTDQGELPLHVSIQFIAEQHPENLVAPFVTPRQAREQEYRPIQYDAVGHDYYSKYYNNTVLNNGGIRSLRLQVPRLWPKQRDDEFLKVSHKASWLDIAYKQYGEIRYWRCLAEIYVQDSAELGLDRSIMNPSYVPPYGSILRAPSRARILRET
jgi:phage baseplate assembly protein W